MAEAKILSSSSSGSSAAPPYPPSLTQRGSAVEPQRTIDPREERDDLLLEKLGYKPELKRSFSPLALLGVSFSIMSVAPSIATEFSTSIGAGGVGMTWGWFVPCFFIMTIGVSMSEMGSAMPTSGGLYWWTYKFAPGDLRRSENGLWYDIKNAPASSRMAIIRQHLLSKRFWSFLCGYADTLGLIAGGASINYGFALQLLACPQLAIDGFSYNYYECYGVYAAATISMGIVSCLPNRILSHIQTGTIALNLIAVGILVIAVPVGLKRQGISLNSGSFVFGNETNSLNYSYGWSFLLSWMNAIWSVSSHDSNIHMGEEANNAGFAIPFGIIMSIGLCWVLGFLILAVLAAVVDPSPDGFAQILDSDFPIVPVIQRALNDRWAIGIMALFCVIQWCMGLSSLIATSRQTWAFARDDALPFSRILKKITSRGIPYYSLCFDVIIALLIGLLILAGDTAAEAIFSLGVTSLYLAWCLPIWFRTAFFDPNAFEPGVFYLGHKVSWCNNLVASIYGVFVIFALTIIPSDIPVTDADEMNYTVLICGAVWLGATIYYWVDAHKWYEGPKMTLNPDEFAIVEATELPPESGVVDEKHAQKLGPSRSQGPQFSED